MTVDTSAGYASLIRIRPIRSAQLDFCIPRKFENATSLMPLANLIDQLARTTMMPNPKSLVFRSVGVTKLRNAHAVQIDDHLQFIFIIAYTRAALIQPFLFYVYLINMEVEASSPGVPCVLDQGYTYGSAICVVTICEEIFSLYPLHEGM